MSIDGGLRKLFKDHLPRFDCCAIETGGIVGRGVPDMNYCCDGFEGWVECKRADHWRVEVRPEQVGWTERRLAHGGLVFCAVRQRRDDTLWLYHGSALRALKTQRLDAVSCIGMWTGGPGKWNWLVVDEVLRGRHAEIPRAVRSGGEDRAAVPRPPGKQPRARDRA